MAAVLAEVSGESSGADGRRIYALKFVRPQFPRLLCGAIVHSVPGQLALFGNCLPFPFTGR